MALSAKSAHVVVIGSNPDKQMEMEVVEYLHEKCAAYGDAGKASAAKALPVSEANELISSGAYDALAEKGLSLLMVAMQERAKVTKSSSDNKGENDSADRSTFSDKDVEACICVLSSVMGRLGRGRYVELVGRMSAAVVKMMSGDQPQQPSACIKLLVSIFNACPYPSGKVAVLTTMVDHANGGGASAETVAALITSGGMKESMAAWAAEMGEDDGVKLEDWRRLLSSCSDCLCKTQMATS